MARKYTRDEYMRLVEKIKKAMPHVALTTDIIVGFPGETEREFEELLEFLEQAQLDRVGCFAYSPVEGAPANALPDPVPEAVKEERRGRFMRAQEAVSARKLRAKVGRTLQVLVDAPGVGRSAADAPEIDGTVRFRGGKAGEFRNVVIERASAHDLHGRLA